MGGWGGEEVRNKRLDEGGKDCLLIVDKTSARLVHVLILTMFGLMNS